jgi:hypothetical protein
MKLISSDLAREFTIIFHIPFPFFGASLDRKVRPTGAAALDHHFAQGIREGSEPDCQCEWQDAGDAEGIFFSISFSSNGR